MTTLKIGLVGASRVATYAMIAPAADMDGVEIAAIAARDAARATAYAEKHGIARAFGAYADLMRDPELDLIYIATPPSAHAEQALAAIGAGKHVLVEKPFTTTSAEAQRVHDAAAEAGVQVFEAMHSPHHALFKRILNIVGQGELGEIAHIEAAFNAPIDKADPVRWRRDLGGGALMDLGVYPLAWLRRLAGESFAVSSAQADIQGDVDASFEAALQFANGVTAKLSASMTVDKPMAHLMITGAAGALKAINPVAPQLGHALTIKTGDRERTETVDGPSSYAAQLLAIKATLLAGARFPFPGDDYIRSMQAIERVRAGFASR